MEWLKYTEPYSDEKTKIISAAFCSNEGIRYILHIDQFKDSVNPERSLLIAIIREIIKYDTIFTYYGLGVRVKKIKNSKSKKKTVAIDNDSQQVVYKGHDSDLVMLYYRCKYHGIEDLCPVFFVPDNPLSKPSFKKDIKTKHIDIHNTYTKAIIQIAVFARGYKDQKLPTLANYFFGFGKATYINPKTGKRRELNGVSVQKLDRHTQTEYNVRDAELTMMLAIHDNCFVLELHKIFADYSNISDLAWCCNTSVSTWYKSRYKNMIQQGLCPPYNNRLDSKDYPHHVIGGHSIIPKYGFYRLPIIEIDVSGNYPGIAIRLNLGYNTVNCKCHAEPLEKREKCLIPEYLFNKINEGLAAEGFPIWTIRPWICPDKKGAYAIIASELVAERQKYKTLLEQELSKPIAEQDQNKIKEYTRKQKAFKTYNNAGFGVHAMDVFEYENTIVANIITAEGRYIHEQLEKIASEKFGCESVFGFTDAIFFKTPEWFLDISNGNNDNNNNNNNTKPNSSKLDELISYCENQLHIELEHKETYLSSIFFEARNKYAAIKASDPKHTPHLDNLDGMTSKDPFWITQQVIKLGNAVLQSQNDKQVVESTILESFDELSDPIKNQKIPDSHLLFSNTLSMDPEYYGSNNDHNRIIGSLVKAKSGERIFYFVTGRPGFKNATKTHAAVPSQKYSIFRKDIINYDHYKQYLWTKLVKILEATKEYSVEEIDNIKQKCLSRIEFFD